MFEKKDQLAINGGTPVIKTVPGEKHFAWPPIDQTVIDAVTKALRAGVISSYDGKEFLPFEKKFLEFIGGHDRHALLTNSGTSAIETMFYAVGIKPGDVVIGPSNTFHASISPVMNFGAIPKFADADASGNIDPNQIEKLIQEGIAAGKKPKAVVVTHLWGMPADMEKISAICKKNDVILLEDCSHAHGATIKGKTVGTFGDAAAWSLQGPKTISGGELGIVVTKDVNMHNRALIYSDYNKRPQRELPKGDALGDFALTGLGKKYRANVLAVAMAMPQLENIKPVLEKRRKYANELIAKLSKYDFIDLPKPAPGVDPTWYRFSFTFHPEKAGVSSETFLKACQAEGLIELDTGGSTGLVHKQALFTRPQELGGTMGTFYPNGLPTSDPQPMSNYLHANGFRIPIWGLEKDRSMFEKYAKGLNKVLNAIDKKQLKETPRTVISETSLQNPRSDKISLV